MDGARPLQDDELVHTLEAIHGGLVSVDQEDVAGPQVHLGDLLPEVGAAPLKGHDGDAVQPPEARIVHPHSHQG